MLTAKLTRSQSFDQGTFGVLVFGANTVRTLELPWRDNTPQKSCIPVGVYRCEIVKSPKFGKVYHVTNVPRRYAVLIHSANFAGDVDKGWTTQLHGCIAPFLKSGVMRNNSGVMQAAGLVSKPALNLLMEWAEDQPFNLEIVWAN